MSKMKSVYGEPKDNYTFKIRLKSTILVIWFVILTIICLLPIYILIINATRGTSEIANGISFLPGSHLGKNFDTTKGILRWKHRKYSYKPLLVIWPTANASGSAEALAQL